MLNGIKVLDLTRVLAGPYATMLLADLGAEVTKVESPNGGDPTRDMGPPSLGGVSSYFLNLNRNKRSIVIDLKATSGRERFFELIPSADVVIENFRPGVANRLGIGPERLRLLNPQLVTCSISGFGSDGPYRDLPAYDLILQAMGGAMSVTGHPEGEPLRMGLPMGDLAGGLFAALAVCAAIVERAETRIGRHIDLSLLDAQVSLLSYMGSAYLHGGDVPGPVGSGHHTVVPYQAFATADDPIVVAVYDEHSWQPFCGAVGLPELIDRYPRNEDRRQNRDELVQILDERFRTQGSEAWLRALRSADVPAAPINSIADVMRDPQVRHRRMVQRTVRPHPEAGIYTVIGNPIHAEFPGQDPEPHVYHPAPQLGEHDQSPFSECKSCVAEEE